MPQSLARTGIRFALAGAFLLVSAAAQANLVTNPGFETGDFTGWTLFDNTAFTSVEGAFGVAPHSGSYQAAFGQIGPTGGIFQTLATTPGQTYDIEFWLNNLFGTPNSFEFNWDGGAAEVSLSNAAALDYTLFSFSLVATSSSTDLRFTFRHDPSYYLLDSVSVTAADAAVPEPGTLALLGLGLAGLAASRRRKQ